MSFARYTAAALLPVAVLGSGLVIPDDNRMVQEDGLIRFPVIPQTGAPLFGKHSNHTKRQIATDSLAQRSGTLYTIELTLGTPGQTVPVHFDTGSSELWVNPVCSKSTTPDFCNAQPRFTESSTLVDLEEQGHVTYGTGYADFEYVADYVGIGSAKITQQIFGVAFDSAHAVVGLMGAGPDLEGWDSAYPLVIDSLAQQGLTNSRAFSMDLRGLDSARGSVIFGGIDVKKYTGNLVKVPIIPAAESPDGLTRFWVHVNEIKVNQPGGNVVEVYKTPAGSKGQPVLLDSGYTLSALPKAIIDKLVSAFPSAQYVPDSDVYVVDCLDPGQGGSLDFVFAGTTINVRYYDFVWHLPDSPYCVLGAFEDNEFPVLGDTFLRAAYVVYDWDNTNIHLGQSEDCGSKLVPIGKGPDAVPSLAGECGQTTTSTSTIPSSTSTTSTSSTSSTSESTTETTSTTSEPVSSTSTTSGSASSTTSTSETSTSETSSSSTSQVSSTSSNGSTSTSKTSTSESSSSTSHASSTSSSGSTSTSGASSTQTTGSASTTTHSTATRSTITYTKTNTYTITSCPPTVTSCPINHVTTEVITATTTICPETTGTYTLTKTITCPAHGGDCTPKTQTLTVTVSPLAPSERTTHVVPGCTPGATGPSVCAQCGTGAGPTTLVSWSASATATAVPTWSAGVTTTTCPGGAAGCGGGVNGTVTGTAGAKPTKVVTAGAASVGVASGIMAVVVGVMAVMGL